MPDVSVPDLTGKLAVVTGASDGVGLVWPTRLAAAGAEVLLPVRNPARARPPSPGSAGGPGAASPSVTLDLASLDSVAALADTLRPRAGRSTS